MPGLNLKQYFFRETSLEEARKGADIWEENPLPFNEWLVSKDHMNFPPYSERQLDATRFMFDFKNPKNSFQNQHYLCLLEYGKGSGKDTIACHCCLYSVYLLLCSKHPELLFGKPIPKGESIDILNIAQDASSAKDVFFKKLFNATRDWKWLRNKYSISLGGKLIHKIPGAEVVRVSESAIHFPKNICAVSKHSEQEAVEGRNTLVYILDEIAGFPDKGISNGREMFKRLVSSSMTRFDKMGKGFVISFPRYKDDLIQQLIEEYKDDPEVYTDVATTFEVKPKQCFTGNWVKWEGYDIPETFLTEFEKDPDNAKCKYLCIPPDSDDPWIQLPEKIDLSINKSATPLFKFFDDTPILGADGKYQLIKKIESMQGVLSGKSFVIGGDIGTVVDRSALSMWYREQIGDRYVFKQAFGVVWYPDKDKKEIVSIQGIQDLLLDIVFKFGVPITDIVFDHHQSEQFTQFLSTKGVNCRRYTLKLEDFNYFRNCLYSGSLEFLDIPVQEKEMKRLVNDGSSGVNIIPNHKQGEHDDLFRANVCAIAGFKRLLDENTLGNNFISELGTEGMSGEKALFNAIENINGL